MAATWPALAAAWLGVFALAIAGRHVLIANTDVSWLITVAEKTLDGARPYVDIVELNPPMSIYLYMPAVLAGRFFGLASETALDCLVLALGLVAVVWSGRRLPADAVEAGARLWFAPLAFAVVAILPAMGFGQREHIALILFLPWLALMLRRAHGEPLVGADSLVAGLAGGLVMAIKPHFALAFAAASLAAAMSSRAWQTIFAIENIVAGLVVVAYGAAVFVFFPAYGVAVLPIIELYLSARQPIAGMLFGALPTLALELVAVAGFVTMTRGRTALAPWVATLLAAIAGFVAAAIIQGKGWPYHFYPALALVVLLVGALAARRPETGRIDWALAAIALAFFAQVWRWDTIGLDTSPLQAPLAAVRAHPRVIALASDPAVSFPTTRAVGGVWVDQAFIGWVPYYAGGLAARPGFEPERLPALRALVESARRALADDLRRRRADALLIERRPFDFLEWARRDAELADLLACFHPAASVPIGASTPSDAAPLEAEVWATNDAGTVQSECLSHRSAAR